MLKLLVNLRIYKGKSYSRFLRINNKIPSIVYGHNKPNIILQINYIDLVKININSFVYGNIFYLLIYKKLFKVFLKEIYWHPYKDKIMHIDFFY